MNNQELFSLRFTSGKIVRLQDGMTLSAEDFLALDSTTKDGVFAEVSQNPNDPTVLGLKNLSQQVWTATLADGSLRQVEPSRSIKLVNEATINFGPVSGTIHETSAGCSLTLSPGFVVPLKVGQKVTTSDLFELKGQGLVAEVSRNPNDPAALGLKNLTNHTWTVVVPDGTQRSIAPGKSIKLAVGTTINFGGVEGEVHTALLQPFVQSGSRSRGPLRRLLVYMAVAFLLGVGLRFLLGAFVPERRASNHRTLPRMATEGTRWVSLNKFDFNKPGTIILTHWA
jgi:hypothetical protein